MAVAALVLSFREREGCLWYASITICAFLTVAVPASYFYSAWGRGLVDVGCEELDSHRLGSTTLNLLRCDAGARPGSWIKVSQQMTFGPFATTRVLVRVGDATRGWLEVLEAKTYRLTTEGAGRTPEVIRIEPKRFVWF